MMEAGTVSEALNYSAILPRLILQACTVFSKLLRHEATGHVAETIN
jgi:hypothetical protein